MYIMKIKSKINNFNKQHKLLVNILGKSVISINALLVAYCIAVYPIIYTLINIVAISTLLLIAWLIWDKEVDLLDFLNKK